MSSLIFYTDREQVLVATDTLAVKEGGKPLMLCSKLPHLRTIVAGTGMGMFSGDWAMSANNRMVLSGIKNLNEHTPGALRSRWQQYRTEFKLPPSMTTTVYHFGFGEDDDEVCAYAYRSTNDFQSERLAYGYGLKPECSLPTEGSLVEALPSMMAEQRQTQAAKPAEERLYIGGECIAMHLTKHGCHTFPAFRFPDYAADLAAIFRNHAASGA